MGLKYLIFFIVLLMKKIRSIPSGNFASCNCKVDKLSNKVKVTLFLGKFLYKTDILAISWDKGNISILHTDKIIDSVCVFILGCRWY